MKVSYKNEWGTAGSNLDPQRADLFKFVLDLPPEIGNAGSWASDIQFAVENFPFPDTKQETTDLKFLNQINKILLADTATSPITVAVRYAFNQATAQTLYRWKYLTSNPRTGGTGQTSKVKTTGHFYWLIPNMVEQGNAASAGGTSYADVLQEGLPYMLEGCMITNLKPSDGDMKATGETALVKLSFELTIDRYYPVSLSKMIFGKT